MYKVIKNYYSYIIYIDCTFGKGRVIICIHYILIKIKKKMNNQLQISIRIVTIHNFPTLASKEYV